MPEPATEQENEELNRYLELNKHFQAALAEIPKKYRRKNTACRLSRIVPIGLTPEGDHVCLIMQGMLAENQFHGGCFAVVCDPFGLEELQQDLNDTEAEIRPEIEKIFEPLIKTGEAKYE
jgi:hypothetical protein